MKILMLSEFIEAKVAGASFRVKYLTALKMSELGHDVVLVSPSSKSMRTTVRRVSTTFTLIETAGLLPGSMRSGGFGFCDMIQKSLLVLRSNFDVVHATSGHRPAQFVPCLIAKVAKKVTIVAECWEWLGRGGYAEFRRGIVGRLVALYDALFEVALTLHFDQIVTISNVLKARFYRNRNVTVLHGGTEIGSLKNYRMDLVRSELGIKQDAFVIGMSNVCAFDNKDNHVFFDAFEMICKDFPEVLLVITSPDPEYIDRLKHDYTFSDRIVFPGWVTFESYNKYMSACNLFALPLEQTSINAGRWPNKIGDYLCLGRPVITNPTGDLRELFSHYRIGLLCDWSAQGFYSLMRRVISGDVGIALDTTDSEYVAERLLSFNGRVEKLLERFAGRAIP